MGGPKNVFSLRTVVIWTTPRFSKIGNDPASLWIWDSQEDSGQAGLCS